MSPRGTTEPSCIFCKIIKRELPSNIIEEDSDVIAIRDINPQAPTHALIIPKEHIKSIAEWDDPEALGKLFQKACDIARQERLTDGFRVVVNTGDDAGQTVHHLHIHVLGGRRLHWPPG